MLKCSFKFEGREKEEMIFEDQAHYERWKAEMLKHVADNGLGLEVNPALLAESAE